jgi:hypothetical protein
MKPAEAGEADSKRKRPRKTFVFRSMVDSLLGFVGWG